MHSEFRSRKDVLSFAQELRDFYPNYGYVHYEKHIDNLFECGLTLNFDPKYEDSYWRFGSDFARESNFFKNGDPNLLVIIFKGLVVCEFHIFGGGGSVSPVNFLNSVLINKLTVAMYNELCGWIRSYPANTLYRTKSVPKPIFRSHIAGTHCSSCRTYSRLKEKDTELTFKDYQAITQERNNKEKLVRNRCPKCQEYQLKENQTRWGHLIICSNYPECDFSKKI